VGKYVVKIKEDLSVLVSNNEIMQEDVSDVKRVITNLKVRQDGCDQEVENKKLKEWLTKCDPTPLYQSYLEKASPGSGKWFLDHDFDAWLEMKREGLPQIMWLRGKSGIGKTTLLSLAISYLQQQKIGGGVPSFAYFYCSFSTKESQSTSNMLGSYIAQLLDQIDCLEEIVKSMQTESKTRHTAEQEGPPIEGLERVLDSACGMANRVLLFLDAPNESDTSDEMLDILAKLAHRNNNLKILISSTEDLDLRHMIQASPRVWTVEMDSRNVDPDICSYIDMRIQKERRLRKLPPHIQTRIRDILARNARAS
jgi:hypothetical protein